MMRLNAEIKKLFEKFRIEPAEAGGQNKAQSALGCGQR